MEKARAYEAIYAFELFFLRLCNKYAMPIDTTSAPWMIISIAKGEIGNSIKGSFLCVYIQYQGRL